MAKQVIFNLLDSEQDHLMLACQLSADFYRNNQRVFIFCDDQQMAHKIDEMLWSFDSDSFVPHNLPGEGQFKGSPVEISWQAPTNLRNVLINLASEVPNFAGQFNKTYDFVPNDETLKKLARLRYRGYQQLGLQVSTEQIGQLA
ncbi:DNA polymerase III subunit chi [Thalassotalea crassostreae]|uniref:DNA polymerase III subunit chi n=1 Tax=Thalassotalea crassostreae TaxID=1763536 RepID=UPI0008387FEC|nr:DNA polymerase III subunit chi [Thalassotalea crassostreae]